MKSDHLKKTALRYFLEVARCGSITEAAERLHVAASAVSRQIKGLEDALDVKIFERRPRGVVLSAAGELLAAHARQVTLDADRVVAEILAMQGLSRGRVRLACTEGFAVDFVPRVLHDFHVRHPRIQYELEVSSPDGVAQMLRNGDVDVGLTYSRLAHPELKVEFRQSSPVMMIARPDHPLAGRRHVALRQLSGYPMVLPSASSSLRQLFDIACSRNGVVIEPLLTSNSAQAIHRFILASGHASIAGRVSVLGHLSSAQLVAVPLQGQGLTDRGIELQTLAGRTLPNVVKSLLDFIKQRLLETDL